MHAGASVQDTKQVCLSLLNHQSSFRGYRADRAPECSNCLCSVCCRRYPGMRPECERTLYHVRLLLVIRPSCGFPSCFSPCRPVSPIHPKGREEGHLPDGCDGFIVVWMCVKTHQIVYLRCMQVTVFQFYLKKIGKTEVISVYQQVKMDNKHLSTGEWINYEIFKQWNSVQP